MKNLKFNIFATHRIIFCVIAVITLSTSFTPSAAAKISLQNLPSPECLMSYAKSHEIGENSTTFHNEKMKSDEKAAECASARQNLISEVRTGIRLKINEMEITAKYRNCVYEMLTGTEKFVYSIMKTVTSELEKNNTKNVLNTTISGVLQNMKKSIELCQREEEYGRKFDKIFEQGKKLSNFEEYCIKKYLIKNNFIDIYQYDIDPNPRKINITGLNCEEMIRKSNEEIYEQLSETFISEKRFSSATDENEKIECAVDKFREADYFDLTLKITALATLAITTEQKLLERESFTKAFAKISSNIEMIC